MVEERLECFRRVSDWEPCAEVQTAPAWKEQLEQLGVAVTSGHRQWAYCRRRLAMTKPTAQACQQQHTSH